jgi:uncharacterized protein with PIN domain
VTEDADVIADLEARRYQAMLRSDAAALEELCDDELIYTHSDGARESAQAKQADATFGRYGKAQLEFGFCFELGVLRFEFGQPFGQAFDLFCTHDRLFLFL